jgi:hypothetical protein
MNVQALKAEVSPPIKERLFMPPAFYALAKLLPKLNGNPREGNITGIIIPQEDALTLGRDFEILQVQIARDEKDNYGLETCLYEPDVRRARFYVSEMEPDDLMLNAHLHEQLTAQSSVWIDKPYLDELSGWKGEVGVRAAHPLSSPVSVRDDYRVYALETRAIHGIQSFYSEELGCTMAHVVIEGRRGNLTTTSDWAPLSDFEFYQYNYSEADAAIGRIAYEATQLLDGMIDITPVNQLLADATPRVMYDVLYDRYSYSPSARFIIGV